MVEVVVLSDDDIMPASSGTNYFSQITSKLNSLNGATASSNLSSGSTTYTLTGFWEGDVRYVIKY